MGLIIAGVVLLVWAFIWNRLQRLPAFAGSDSTGAIPAAVGILLIIAGLPHL